MSEKIRATFFKLLFGAHDGYVCISRLSLKEKAWSDTFFEWPREANRVEAFIETYRHSNDLYVCPQLLIRPKRRKDAIKCTPTAWSDLDECNPKELRVRPTVTVESSPGRFQAYWVFADEEVPAFDAQDISRRIAYSHADKGADKSGWDLTQVLRIPTTYNFKYAETGVPPVVNIIDVNNDTVKLEHLREQYPQVQQFAQLVDLPQPEEVEASTDVIMRHNAHIHPYAMVLFSTQPKDGDWSTALWNLEMMLFENGMTCEEVFAIVRDAQCNKYERDGRGDTVLWKEVLRAKEKKELDNPNLIGSMFDGPGQLLTDEERIKVGIMPDSFVENYIKWATEASDAAPQYHQASALVALSSLLSSKVRLPTGPDIVQLNLWFMILGDTTLTRKTTAMNMGTNLVEEIDNNAILATDGSVEGVFRAMSGRPGRTSVFLRDEFSGLLRAMSSKDYMSGMVEALTKLYDGKFQKRVLSKEVIEIREPLFIFFTGGIKTAILELFNKDHVISGFLPRFIFITAEADITMIKPLGPPTQKNDRGRKDLLKRLQEVHNHYHNATVPFKAGDVTKMVPKKWDVELTPEAWAMYNRFEMSLLHYGRDHQESVLVMPCMSRLAMSGLKVAALIAAERRLETNVIVTEDDILHAFSYVETWRDDLIEVLDNIGKTPYEKTIDMMVAHVHREPGIARGTLMRIYKMSKKSADDIFDTAEQRGMIKVIASGRSSIIFPPNYTTGE